MEVLVATGAIRRAKLQSNCYHQQLAVWRRIGEVRRPRPAF